MINFKFYNYKFIILEINLKFKIIMIIKNEKTLFILVKSEYI